MDSQSTGRRARPSSQFPRARKLKDEEWEPWREKLTSLYTEEDMSRKDIIELMKNEHGFEMT